jgi:hypothetical protein
MLIPEILLILVPARWRFLVLEPVEALEKITPVAWLASDVLLTMYLAEVPVPPRLMLDTAVSGTGTLVPLE